VVNSPKRGRQRQDGARRLEVPSADGPRWPKMARDLPPSEDRASGDLTTPEIMGKARTPGGRVWPIREARTPCGRAWPIRGQEAAAGRSRPSGPIRGRTKEAGADLGRRWPGRTLGRRAERGLAADDGQAQATNGDSGQNGNRRWPGRAGGGHKQRTGGYESPKTSFDTMLGIDKLYSIGAKGHNI
jgi:hypothetical protein